MLTNAILIFAFLMGLVLLAVLVASGIGAIFSIPSLLRLRKQFEADMAKKTDAYVHVPDGRRLWFTKGVVVCNRDQHGTMMVPASVMETLLYMARSSKSYLRRHICEGHDVNIWHLRAERVRGYRLLSAVYQPMGRI